MKAVIITDGSRYIGMSLSEYRAEQGFAPTIIVRTPQNMSGPWK